MWNVLERANNSASRFAESVAPEAFETNDNKPLTPTRHRPFILHITGDYPDPVRECAGPSVKNFIDLLGDYDHLILSIKRCSRRSQCYLREFDEGNGRRVIALGYQAFPANLFHRSAMTRLALRIASLLSERALLPDLIMAHRLTLEGVVAHHLGKLMSLPYVSCVRGEADGRFLRRKPELKMLFGRVVSEATALFFVSAWFRKRIETRYPGQVRRQELLPNFAGRTIFASPAPKDPHSFVTILNLDAYRRKGFEDLVAAARLAQLHVPDLRLDVIGSATHSTMRRLRRLVEKARVGNIVRFLGPLSHDDVLQAIPRYAALVLPAREETFGMVYIEALLSGIPILYTADSGIDGYVDGMELGVRVRAGDVAAIADGIRTLAFDGRRFRKSVHREYAAIQNVFAPNAYLDRFRALVEDVRRSAVSEARRHMNCTWS